MLGGSGGAQRAAGVVVVVVGFVVAVDVVDVFVAVQHVCRRQGDCLKTKKAGGGLGGRAQRPPRSQAKVLASLVVFGFVVAAAAAVVVVGFVVRCRPAQEDKSR